MEDASGNPPPIPPKKRGRPKMYDVPYYQRTKEWRLPIIRERSKLYYKNNRERVLARERERLKLYKDEINELKRMRYNGYKKGDVIFILD